MRRASLWIGVGVLALLAGGAALLRRPDPASVPAAPAPPVAAAVAADPASVPLRLSAEVTAVLVELQAEAERHRVQRSKPTAADTAASQARRAEAERAADFLGERLLANPTEWNEATREMGTLGNLKVLMETAALLSWAVDDAGEGVLHEILRRRDDPARVRHAAVALLADLPSERTLQALAAAAEGDTDSGVRLEALTQVARRRQTPPTPGSLVLIEETIKRQSALETDPYVKDLMVRLQPGFAPQLPPLPKDPHKGGHKFRASVRKP